MLSNYHLESSHLLQGKPCLKVHCWPLSGFNTTLSQLKEFRENVGWELPKAQVAMHATLCGFPGLLETTVNLLQKHPRWREAGFGSVLWKDHHHDIVGATHQSSVRVCSTSQNRQGSNNKSSWLKGLNQASPRLLNRWGNWGLKRAKYLPEVMQQDSGSALFLFISACITENVHAKMFQTHSWPHCP